MAEVRPLRKDIEVPERKTPDHITELIDELRGLAESGVLSAIAVVYVVDGQPDHNYGYEAGEAYQLSGAVHSMALALDHELTFSDEDE